MKTIYLHIGAHKTGTTALQYFLWNNRKRLRREGYLYPELGLGGNSHGVLGNILKPNNRDPRLPEFHACFEREVLRGEYDKIILSSEVFLEGMDVAAAARDFFAKDICNVKVIVFLRNQADWLESVFHEIVRDPYRRYTGDIQHMREYQQGLHDYGCLIKPWRDHFGDDAMVLCPYEIARRDGGIFTHLLELLDVENPNAFDFTVNENNQNLRLHPLASEFLRRANRFPMLNGEHKALVADLQRISPRIGQWFDARFRLLGQEAIAGLANEFAGRNRELFASYSRYGATALFEDATGTSMEQQVGASLGADVQHALFDALKPRIQALLEEVIPKARNRRRGEAFLHPPPEDQEKRLNEVIFRQRLELRRLYQKYGDEARL